MSVTWRPTWGPEFPVLNTESFVPDINGTSKGETFVSFSSRLEICARGKAMTDDLDQLKAQRRGHRGVATKYVQALVTGMSIDEPVINPVMSSQSSLKEDKQILQASPSDTGKLWRRMR